MSKFVSVIAFATSITMLTPSAYAAQFSGTDSKVEASVAAGSAFVEPWNQSGPTEQVFYASTKPPMSLRGEVARLLCRFVRCR